MHSLVNINICIIEVVIVISYGWLNVVVFLGMIRKQSPSVFRALSDNVFREGFQ